MLRNNKNLNRWILEFCVMLMFVGIFEFFYIWTFKFNWANNNFTLFMIQFVQVYSVLFIPIISYLGFKYRNSLKYNSKNSKLFFNILLILVFSVLVYFYHPYGLWQWSFLFIGVFALTSIKYNSIFALSFSFLSFVGANMLFEFQGLDILKSGGTLLSYILVFGIYILILYKEKVKIDYRITISLILLVIYWIYTFPIWSLDTKDFFVYYLRDDIDLVVRLFTFPLMLSVAIRLYLSKNRHNS